MGNDICALGEAQNRFRDLGFWKLEASPQNPDELAEHGERNGDEFGLGERALRERRLNGIIV